MTEYDILSLIHKNGGTAEYSDIAAASIASNKPDILSDDLRLKYLIDEKYVSGDPLPLAELRLTKKGIIRLDELSQERAEKRNQRIFEFALAIVSALAGALLSEPVWSIIEKLFS